MFEYPRIAEFFSIPWEWKDYRHLGTIAIGGTRLGGTCGDYGSGRWTKCPDESQHHGNGNWQGLARPSRYVRLLSTHCFRAWTSAVKSRGSRCSA
eukprot:scaffold12883_cov157-Isochrysis_galbana.AAC.1